MSPPSALPLTPAAAASAIAAGNGTPAPLAYESIFATDVSPTPATRRVDDALPRHFVVGIHERAQIRERVFDLPPVVELHAAEHSVRQAGAHQRLFENAALRVGSVEDGDVAVPMLAFVDQAVNLPHDERGFIAFVVSLEADDGFALALVGPELLGPVRRVVLDHRVGRVEDALRRPVVLVEHNRYRFRKRLLELQQVPKVRATKLIDRVVRDDPVRNEVVRPIDIDVVHRLIDLDPLDVGDDVELAPASSTMTMPGRTDDAGMNGNVLAVVSSPFAAKRAL